MAKKDLLGSWGEEYAARYLCRKYGSVLARNWRSGVGEVDIVFRDAQTVVMCEVKTRRSLRSGHPSEAVDHVRLGRLRDAAEVWLQEFPGETSCARVDAISIVCNGGGIELQHFQSVAQ